MSASVALLRRSPEAREAIEDAAPIFEGFDVAFVIHDLAGFDTDDHAEECPGCLMLAEIAAELEASAPVMDPVGACPGCPCSLSTCTQGGCGHACCC